MFNNPDELTTNGLIIYYFLDTKSRGGGYGGYGGFFIKKIKRGQRGVIPFFGNQFFRPSTLHPPHLLNNPNL
jgi:hypothetical protein